MTTPVLHIQLSAADGWPPLQPIDRPHAKPEQQPAVSSDENSTSSPVATQRRSSNASVEPNAQHEPHADWSRTVEITEHLGHCVRASKVSGRSIAASASRSGRRSFSSSGNVPHSCFTAARLSNRVGTVAVQVDDLLPLIIDEIISNGLTSDMCSSTVTWGVEYESVEAASESIVLIFLRPVRGRARGE